MQWSSKSMKELFTNDLTIPEYQRPYTWEQENIEDFFTDLRRFIESGEKYYLFGQIIVHREGDIFNIVDGQQRITTSTIFLCAARDIIDERGYKGGSLYNSICSAIGFSDEGYGLTSGSENREFLLNYVQNGDHGYATKHDSDRRLEEAYLNLRSMMEDYIGNDGESLDRLRKLVTGFLNNFYVSYVETDSLSQAFTVFETLNARGTPLEVPDLLKNHFFSMLDRNHEYVKDNWKEMVRKTTCGKKANTTQFIKYYWNSCHPFTREKDLFKAICGLDRQETFDFLAGLFKSADLYIEIVDPRPSGKYFDDEIIRKLSNLRQFGASSFCPLIMSLNDSGDGNMIGKMVDAIETMILRNQVIGKKTANKNEMLYSKWAFSISDDRMTSAQVLSDIAAYTDSDEDVSGSFRRFSPNEEVGKLLLIEIYNHTHSETRISGNGNQVHLEHILPKKSEKWGLDQEKCKEYSARFGNMTLLDGKKNKQIGNEPFDVKRVKYLESSIDETRDIGHMDSWGFDDIDRRQSELLRKVLEIWPKPRIEVTTLDRF